ncbi:hypothetical protein F2Q70_00035935 [Brassica cretica]|uniref:Uncharacterized protein n=1 Tax=Brassica cretica TaxID=69181 RepID=A0A8S9JSY5_BRACR|nr:hypothetical protein F2Q70_00035935 [Brassica cretica]
MGQEVFKRVDLEAFFKAYKESGNTLGNTLGYSYAAHTLPSNTDKLLDIFKSSYTAATNPSNTDKLLDMFKSAYTTASEPSITSAKVGESEGRALASHQIIGKGMNQEVFKRADLEAFFKALKESGNTLGNTLGYSYAAHTLPSTTDKLLEIFISSYTAASNPDKLLDMFKSAYTATSTSKSKKGGLSPGFPLLFPEFSKENLKMAMQYISHSDAAERSARVQKMRQGIEEYSKSESSIRLTRLTSDVDKGKEHVFTYHEPEDARISSHQEDSAPYKIHMIRNNN